MHRHLTAPDSPTASRSLDRIACWLTAGIACAAHERDEACAVAGLTHR